VSSSSFSSHYRTKNLATKEERMSTPALSRAEFIRLLLPTDEEIEQEVEGRRLRKCAELARAIAEIVDQPQHRGRSYRQIAAELGVHEGTRLLELVDLLENETRDHRPKDMTKRSEPKHNHKRNTSGHRTPRHPLLS
jgi:hypothetical protein